MREEGSHVAEAGEDEGHPAPPRHMEGVCGDTDSNALNMLRRCVLQPRILAQLVIPTHEIVIKIFSDKQGLKK